VGLFANIVRLIGERAFPGLIVFSIVGSVLLVLFMLAGFFIVNPNEGACCSSFGTYVGTARKTGLQWLVPFYTRKSVSPAHSEASKRAPEGERQGG
jgi:regulator of protease activity HflC (stomatin/prohibitin superfamily)